MAKKIIMALIAILCVLLLTSCIVEHRPIIPIILLETGKSKDFRVGTSEYFGHWSNTPHWDLRELPSRELIDWHIGHSYSFLFEEEGEYILGVKVHYCLFIRAPNYCRIEADDYRFWYIKAVNDITAFNENNPDFQIEAEEKLSNFEANWDFYVEDESLEFIESE